jgi:uncharacterized membrane protein YbhN (UPF0104 family)
MRKPTATLLRWGLGLGITVLFCYAGRKYLAGLGRLREVPPLWVLANAAVYLLTRYGNGEVLRLALNRVGCTIRGYEAFMLNMVMSYTNLLVPHAGMGPPAMYLKQKYGVAYSDYVALFVPTIALQLVCAGVCGLGAMAWLVTLGQGYSLTGAIPLFLLFAAVLVSSLVLCLCPLPVPATWNNRVANVLRRFSQTWSFLRHEPRLTGRLLAIQLAVVLLRALRLQLAFCAVGVGWNFPVLLVASTCAQFMLFISITPGALGFREAAIGYIMYSFCDPSLSVAASLLDRLVMTALIVGVAQIGLLQFVRPVLRRLA